MTTLANKTLSPSSKTFPSLTSEAQSSEPLTEPQIHNLWLQALSLYEPLKLSFRPTVTAHKHLIKHLLKSPDASPQAAPTSAITALPSATTTTSRFGGQLSTNDLKSAKHAPHVFFLFLNLGLVNAFQGEYYLASRHFRTAVSIDDRSWPGNTAVGLFLLGLASYLLGQAVKAARLWRQCLTCFRRVGTMDKNNAEHELTLAAPWVTSPSQMGESERGGEREAEQVGKERVEHQPWTGFKHKIYHAPMAKDSEEMSWSEWRLKRRDVERNLQIAQKESGSGHAHPGRGRTVSATVSGIPGGALFWPLEEMTGTPVMAGHSDQATKPIKPSTKQQEVVGLGLDLPTRTAATKWNEGIGSCNPPQHSIRKPQRPSVKLHHQPVLSSPLATSPVIAAPEVDEQDAATTPRASETESPVFAVSPRSAAVYQRQQLVEQPKCPQFRH